MAAKIEEEYANFMKDMKNSNLESEEGIEGLTQALGGLLKGLTDELGIDGVSIMQIRKRDKTSRTCFKEGERRRICKSWQENCLKYS